MNHIVFLPSRKTIWLISPYSYLGYKENQEIFHHRVGRLYKQGWPGLSIDVIHYKNVKNSFQVHV